jgi:GNAT superfamily N-acetyltransferase
MNIIDLNEKHHPAYFHCLEGWSDDMKESGNRKSVWFEKMKEKGLRVKLAVDDNDNAVGMIQYIPIEHSHVEGKDLFFIYCIWVHGHKQGAGNCQKKGIGSALLEAAEADARERGAKGISAWGLALPFWMKASWFKKHGYLKADRIGLLTLMWKPFSENAVAPAWIRPKTVPDNEPGNVTVTSFVNGWCPMQNLAYERTKRASEEFGDKVVFREINTSDRERFVYYGISDGIFIDGKELRFGRAPSYEKIRKAIEKKVLKLR